jgi:hypothetical protein
MAKYVHLQEDIRVYAHEIMTLICVICYVYERKIFREIYIDIK